MIDCAIFGANRQTMFCRVFRYSQSPYTESRQQCWFCSAYANLAFLTGHRKQNIPNALYCLWNHQIKTRTLGCTLSIRHSGQTQLLRNHRSRHAVIQYDGHMLLNANVSRNILLDYSLDTHRDIVEPVRHFLAPKHFCRGSRHPKSRLDPYIVT